MNDITSYSFLFDEAPISLWIEDFSEVKKQFSAFSAAGITDFRAHCLSHPELISECMNNIKIIDVNKTTVALYKARNKEELLKSIDQTFTSESAEIFKEELILLAEGETEVVFEAVTKTMDGDILDIIIKISIPPGFEETWERVLVSITDITKNKQTEKELRRSNRAYKTLTYCNETIIHADNEQDLYTNICQAIVNQGGYSLVWIGLIKHDANKSILPVGESGFGKDYLESLHVSWADNEQGHGPTGAAIRSKKPSIAKHIQTDPNYALWREQALKHGYHSSIAIPMLLNDKVIGALNIYSNEPDAFDLDEVELLSELANDVAYGIESIRTQKKHIRAEKALEKSKQQLLWSLEGTVHAIAKAVEARDPYTAGHQRRVAKLACAIAETMGLSRRKIEGIKLGATIHDIGKIQIPAELLIKPTKLLTLELELIKTHSQMGYEILKDIKFPWPVADIAHQHHERLDGSGYPKGLKGDDICLEARIVAVADVMEAISSHRPYRAGLGIEFALEHIKEGRGTLYDVVVVDACLAVFSENNFDFSETD